MVRCDACGRLRAPWRCARGVGQCHADAQGTYVAAIVPRVPLRLWTLALPEVGSALARAGPSAWAVLVRAFIAAVFTQLRRRARRHWQVRGRVRCGAVTVLQRQSATGPPSLCVHALLLDGAYVGAPGAAGLFWPDPGVPDADAVAVDVGARLRKAWRQGAIRVTHAPVAGPLVSDGSREGSFSAVGDAIGADRFPPPERVARGRGVVVSMGDRLAAQARADVLAMTRRLTRPAADPRRLRPSREGTVRYQLPFPLADGTRAVVLSPHDVAERLGARVAFAPRRIRYHGILAAGAGARHQILPAQLGLGLEPPTLLRPAPWGGKRPATASPAA